MKLVAKQKGIAECRRIYSRVGGARTLAICLLSLSMVFGRRVALRKT